MAKGCPLFFFFASFTHKVWVTVQYLRKAKSVLKGRPVKHDVAIRIHRNIENTSSAFPRCFLGGEIDTPKFPSTPRVRGDSRPVSIVNIPIDFYGRFRKHRPQAAFSASFPHLYCSQNLKSQRKPSSFYWLRTVRGRIQKIKRPS